MPNLGAGSVDDRERVLEAQRKRWLYLRYLYDQYQAMPSGRVQIADGFAVAREIGVDDRNEADRLFTYLKDQGLIKFMTMGPGVRITQAGIDAVERALSAPETPTESFPAVNILNVFGGVHGSQIQQGVQSSTQSQTVDWKGLQSLVATLRHALSELSGDSAEIASAHLATVEAQSKSPAPSAVIVRESLQSLRAILEQIGSAVAASAITAWLIAQGWIAR